MEKNDFPRRGDVWWADAGALMEEGVQSGMRPWVIVSNNMFNENSPSVTAVPCTLMVKRMHLPTHVGFNIGEKRNVAMCEQIKTFNKGRVTYRICRLTEEVMEKVEEGVRVQLGL